METIKFREVINISNPFFTSVDIALPANLVGTSHDLKDAIDRQVRVPLSKLVAIGNPVALINAS